jgi:hypothetical protein
VGYVFNPPPGWPEPPPGWHPPPGWQPDPSWPAAPVGWQFWRPANPSLVGLVRQLPNLAKGPLGKAAIWLLMAGFACMVVGGLFVGKPHLRALGIVFGALAGLSYVALFGIGVIAVIRFALPTVRRSKTESGRGFPGASPNRGP